jgi:hypothetical protein
MHKFFGKVYYKEFYNFETWNQAYILGLMPDKPL